MAWDLARNHALHSSQVASKRSGRSGSGWWIDKEDSQRGQHIDSDVGVDRSQRSLEETMLIGEDPRI